MLAGTRGDNPAAAFELGCERQRPRTPPALLVGGQAAWADARPDELGLAAAGAPDVRRRLREQHLPGRGGAGSRGAFRARGAARFAEPHASARRIRCRRSFLARFGV